MRLAIKFLFSIALLAGVGQAAQADLIIDSPPEPKRQPYNFRTPGMGLFFWKYMHHDRRSAPPKPQENKWSDLPPDFDVPNGWLPKPDRALHGSGTPGLEDSPGKNLPHDQRDTPLKPKEKQGTDGHSSSDQFKNKKSQQVNIGAVCAASSLALAFIYGGLWAVRRPTH